MRYFFRRYFFQTPIQSIFMLILISLSCFARAQSAANAAPTAIQPEVQPNKIANKLVLAVHPFTVAHGVRWPYDSRALQSQLIASLKSKDSDEFRIVPASPGRDRNDFALEGEITAWHPGKQAVRSIVGFGAGRESATIHYWILDPTGLTIFEHKDVIRESYTTGLSSVGELAHPLAEKVAVRVENAKLP